MTTIFAILRIFFPSRQVFANDPRSLHKMTAMFLLYCAFFILTSLFVGPYEEVCRELHGASYNMSMLLLLFMTLFFFLCANWLFWIYQQEVLVARSFITEQDRYIRFRYDQGTHRETSSLNEEPNIPDPTKLSRIAKDEYQRLRLPLERRWYRLAKEEGRVMSLSGILGDLEP